MITFIASVLLFWMTKYVDKCNDSDRTRQYDDMNNENYTKASFLLLHIRQDIKLIAFFLMAIFLMLAVIADVLADYTGAFHGGGDALHEVLTFALGAFLNFKSAPSH